jgi:hypothetical protein
MVITSYGTGARPLIRCGENKRILASNGPPSLYDYIALIDIEARCYIGDPSDPGYLGANGSRSAGIEVGWPGAHWFLVEGCKFQFFAGVNLGEQDPRVIGSTGPRFGTVYWRRNVITECWGSKQFGGTGIVGNSWLNVYFHDNIWNECANSPRGDASWIMPPGDPTAWSATPPVGPANSHNIYWNFGNYITEFKNNISTNAQYNNYKSRGATNITNSFFARGSQATEQKSGVAATANIGEFGYYTGGTVCNDNVCIEQRSQYWPGSGHSDAGGSGFWFLGYDTPVGISPFEGKRNLIANSQLYNVDGIGITIGAGCVNSTITDNVIFKCFQGIQDLGTGNITSPNKIDLDGDNAEFSFPSPNNAFLGKYNVSLGGADDFDAFMLEACKQSKDNWHPAYTAPAINDFMRRQFGMVELGVDGGRR